MITLEKISKILQVLLLLSFFLPFFSQGCTPKEAEKGSTIDSSIVAQDNTKTETTAFVNKDANQQKVDSTKDGLTDRFSKNSTLLKAVLRPNKNYTGIGYITEVFLLLFVQCGAALAFILWIIGLIVKLKDYNSIFNMINIAAVFSFSFTNPMTLSNVFGLKLWGYWVCLGLAVIMVVYDLVILKIKRSK